MKELCTQFFLDVEQSINQMIDNKVDKRLSEIETDQKTKKEFYTYKEVSTILGVSVVALKSRRKAGTLKVVYLERTPLISDKEVNKIIKRLKKTVKVLQSENIRVRTENIEIRKEATIMLNIAINFPFSIPLLV